MRTLRRRKRNIRHWEKDEPLEGVGDWDSRSRAKRGCAAPSGDSQLLLAAGRARRRAVQEAQRVGQVQAPVGPVVAARELLVLVLDAARVERGVQGAVAGQQAIVGAAVEAQRRQARGVDLQPVQRGAVRLAEAGERVEAIAGRLGAAGPAS